MDTALEARLARENRRLRTAIIAVGAAALGAAAMGAANSQQPATAPTIQSQAITADNGFLYVLRSDGSISRMNIAERARYNATRAAREGRDRNDAPHRWTRFVSDP